MQILVTGGAGFIGSHTVDALVARGYRVRVLDSLEPPVHHGEWPAHLPPQVERRRGSVTDRDALLAALRDVDAVYHLAAYQDYLPDFSRYFLVNSAGTALLYELIVGERLPVRKVIVASSQAVYGGGRYHGARDGHVYPGQGDEAQLARREWDVRCPACQQPAEPHWTDERVLGPHNSYALSKRDQEDVALTLGRRYGVPSVAFRYSIVQGPRQSFRNLYSGALRSFAVAALNGQPPLLYEDGFQRRDYVSIHDVVQANLLGLEDPRLEFQAFNVGSGRQVSVRELAALVLQEVGLECEARSPGLYRVGDTRHIFSDVGRLRALGWEPRVGQRESVREYLRWAAAQPGLAEGYAEARRRMQALGVLRTAGPRDARAPAAS